MVQCCKHPPISTCTHAFCTIRTHICSNQYAHAVLAHSRRATLGGNRQCPWPIVHARPPVDLNVLTIRMNYHLYPCTICTLPPYETMSMSAAVQHIYPLRIESVMLTRAGVQGSIVNSDMVRDRLLGYSQPQSVTCHVLFLDST